MNFIINKLECLMKWIVMGGIREDHDVDSVRRIKMINIASLVGILSLIPLGYSVIKMGNPWLGFFDFVVTAVLLANQVHLRMTGEYKRSVCVCVWAIGLLFFYLFYTGGVDHTGHLFVYLFPMFSIFLLGSKKGLIATTFLVGFILIALSINNDSYSMALYTLSFKVRFVLVAVLLTIYAYFFESTRKAAEKQLIVENVELKQKNLEITESSIVIKQAIQTVETASKTKSEFLANMSHELRTPLNPIIGFTELVKDKSFGALNETQEEYLDDVLTSSRHLLSLINDILDLSKVEAGKLVLKPAEVDLKVFLENSLVMIKENAMKKGICISTDTGDIPFIVNVDERTLKQIIYSILSNAVKFTPQGGRIDLASRKITSDDPVIKEFEIQDLSNNINTYIEISVTDTGIGIKPGDLKRIFNPFEQVDNSASRKFQGTGLGLSLTKSLVELHNGRIRAQSEGEEKGSRISLLLPLVEGRYTSTERADANG